jgi:hypothetical protein
MGLQHGIMVALDEKRRVVGLDQRETFAEIKPLDSEVSPLLVDPDRMFVEWAHRGWRDLGPARGA